MIRQRSVLCIVAVLVLACCQTKSDKERGGEATAQVPVSNNNVSSSSQSNDGVRLRVLERKETELICELENNSNEPISTFYDPPRVDMPVTFVLHKVEYRPNSKSDFKQYSPPYHFIPGAHPVAPHNTIVFQVNRTPKEAGEYRICVRYWDDPNVFKLLHDVWPDVSSDEIARINQSAKIVCSDLLIVPRKAQTK